MVEVLKGASLSIANGDVVAITGASGAGKSTLLHLLGTLESPDRGQITYRGESLVGFGPAALADFRNRELGFVFQFHHLLPELSALENVMMPALIRRYPRGQAEAIAHNSPCDVGLEHRLGHKPGELSGGEQQRVALARALVLSPPLLLADEVTGNLDTGTSVEIHKLLFELNREKGITLVIVTHNPNLAAMAPRQLELRGGQIHELSGAEQEQLAPNGGP